MTELVDILLVEDNPNDVTLALHGEEALAFVRPSGSSGFPMWVSS